MSESDELYYLAPGFDLNSLTVAKLRGILVAHEISYPSSAKKGELVEVVQTKLLPKAKKLLRDRDRVRRTSHGITDVPSSQEGTVDDESDGREMMPPPPAPKTPRGRKSKTNLAQPEVESTPKSTRRSKTPTSRRTVKAPRMSDTETEHDTIPSSVRRTRKSTPGPTPVARTPGVRLSDVMDKKYVSPEADDSPFTQDNPFQQTSSPPSDSKRVPSTSRSRKSIGASSTRKSTSRRRTRSPTVVKKEQYEIPVSHLSTGVDGIETTEEFTEDAEQELRHDLASDRQLAKSRNKDVVRHRRRKPQSAAAKAAPWTVLLAVLGVASGWYRQEKVAIGYCGVGQPRWSLAEGENVPAWVHDALEPQCEPCPQHAICYPNMEVQCERDFVKNQHPLSLNGLIPIPPTCEPDSEKEKRIKSVADRTIQILRDRTAAHECGTDLSDSTTTSTTSEQKSSKTHVSPKKAEISEEALKETISKQRRKNMSPEEFENLWEPALDNVKGREEIEVIEDGSGRIFLKSNSFANLPLTCAIRRSAIRTLAANRIPLLLLILILASTAYGRQRVIAFQAARSQTPALVALTLDRLATQAALKEDGRVQDSFLSVGQLRDLVLSNVFERKERERAWERVKKIVESNSNVRAATREGGKTGEWSRSWEWIGPVNFAPGLEGRTSGLIQSSPLGPDGSHGSTPATEEKRPTEFRKWDEGRVIY